MKRVLTVGRVDKRPEAVEDLPAHLRDRHFGDGALPMWQEAAAPDGTIIGARMRASARRPEEAGRMFRLMLRMVAQEHVRRGGSRRSLAAGASHDLLTGQASARLFSRPTGSGGA